MLALHVLPHAPPVVLSVVAAHHAAVIVAPAPSADTLKPAAPANARAAAKASAAPAASVAAASETHVTFGDSLGCKLWEGAAHPAFKEDAPQHHQRRRRSSEWL